jgi:hypothetical protein
MDVPLVRRRRRDRLLWVPLQYPISTAQALQSQTELTCKCVKGSLPPSNALTNCPSFDKSHTYTLCAALSAAPPANHSPSGLNDIACQAVLLMGSLNRCVGSRSCSQISCVGGGCGDGEEEGECGAVVGVEVVGVSRWA